MAKGYNVQYVSFYTDGNAARKLVPAMETIRAALPKPRRHKRKAIYVDPVALLSIAVAVSMLLMMAVGLVQLGAAQTEARNMEAYVAALQEENTALSLEFEQGYDITQIERTALALGMVPQEQVPQITISVSSEAPQQEQTVTLWEHIGTFLSGLFA